MQSRHGAEPQVTHWICSMSQKSACDILCLWSQGIVCFCSITLPILPKKRKNKKAWPGHNWEELERKGQSSWNLSSAYFQAVFKHDSALKGSPHSLSPPNSIWWDSVWHTGKQIYRRQMWPLMVAKCFEDEKFSPSSKHYYSVSDVSMHLKKKKDSIKLPCHCFLIQSSDIFKKVKSWQEYLTPGRSRE